MQKTRTRIIATIGPTCAQEPVLSQMIQEGVAVFRFNFSHGTLAMHERWLKMVRNVTGGLGAKVGILQDLAGHRIRTGYLKEAQPIQLRAGQQLTLCRKRALGTPRRVWFDYDGNFARIPFGQMIYVDDGKLHLQVIASSRDALETVVIQEGKLGERKGVNMPGATLDFPPLSAKDIRDLKFATKHHVDFVAQSFVRSAEDVHAVRKRIARMRPKCKLIAKIESMEGVKNFEEILRAADGVMVARGDLGISIPIHEIPILQKWIIASCNRVRKPVITATQMLEHMIERRVPTRAEVTDVANAVIDGSDYVMLSGETAMGKHPVEAVRMMRSIVEYTERHMPVRSGSGIAPSCPLFE